MRIAICISGLVRTYRNTFDNFVNTLIKPNDSHQIDVFISTWNVEHSNLSMVRSRQLYNKVKDPIPENDIDYGDIIKKYNPVLIEIDKQIDCRPPKFVDFEVDINQLVTKINTQSFWFMLYKLYACDNLRVKREKLQGWEYDLVVRTRFDVHIPNPIVITDNNPDIMTIPLYPSSRIYKDYEMIFDAFAISGGKLMQVYANWINNVEGLIASGVPIQPESLLFAHLDRNNVPMNKIGLNITFVR